MNIKLKSFHFETLDQMLCNSYKSFYELDAIKVNENGTVKSITYKTFCEDIFYTAEKLKKYKKCRIGMFAATSYAWLVYFYAVIISGNTAVLLNHELGAEAIKKNLNKLELSVVFADNNSISAIRSLLENKDTTVKNMSGFEHSQKVYEHHCGLNHSDDIAVILFTSGTTGDSKAVQLTHKNLCSDLEGCFYLIGDRLNTEIHTSNMAVLPNYHAYQITACFGYQIAYGGCICISENVRYFSDDLKVFRPGALVLVPVIVEMMYKKVIREANKNGKLNELYAAIEYSRRLMAQNIDKRREIFKDILSEFGGNLSIIHCGGAKLDERYIDFFHDIGVDIFFGYGISECSPIIACNTPKKSRAKSVGTPLPHEYVELKIENGEIIARGNIVSPGYYNDAKSNEEMFKDGWFHTGDLGYIDKDGYLFITGRKKNLIILANGENVSPEALEVQLLRYTEIKEVMVREKVHGNGVGVISALVFPNYEAFEESEDELQEKIIAIVKKVNLGNPLHMKIEDIEITETELKKNALGKVIRN